MRTITPKEYNKLSRKEKESFTGIISWNDNTAIQYVKNGKTHRDDGPAIIYYNGQQYYFINGRQCFSKLDWLQQSEQFQNLLVWKNLK